MTYTGKEHRKNQWTWESSGDKPMRPKSIQRVTGNRVKLIMGEMAFCGEEHNICLPSAQQAPLRTYTQLTYMD